MVKSTLPLDGRLQMSLRGHSATTAPSFYFLRAHSENLTSYVFNKTYLGDLTPLSDRLRPLSLLVTHLCLSFPNCSGKSPSMKKSNRSSNVMKLGRGEEGI